MICSCHALCGIFGSCCVDMVEICGKPDGPIGALFFGQV
jgi:hypothetical protein